MSLLTPNYLKQNLLTASVAFLSVLQAVKILLLSARWQDRWAPWQVNGAVVRSYEFKLTQEGGLYVGKHVSALKTLRGSQTRFIEL